MAITIEPLGGLGNQLFIYALGLRLARELNTELICDTWNFHDYSWHSYELDSIPNEIQKTYSSRSRELFGHKARSAIRRARSLHVGPTPFSRLVLERGSTFDPDILKIRDGSRLNGYFQSWRFFEPIAEDIRKQVSNPVQPSPWLHETRERLSALGDWVAVHVRRGTYLEVPIMGLVQDDYYERAIELIDKLVGEEKPLVLFSDSPDLVVNLIPQFQDRLVSLSTPQDVLPIDVIQVMSDAAHLIIGNSTFSWWAAYLKSRPSRFVVAPRPWLDDHYFNERDLFLPDWITVGRSNS